MKITTQLFAIAGVLLIIGLLNTIPVIYQTEKLTHEENLINYTEVVRGGSQRIAKLELVGENADTEIQYIDRLIHGLKMGDSEINLPKLSDVEYLKAVANVENGWEVLKKDILVFRKNPAAQKTLIQSSEVFWDLTSDVVVATSSLVSRDLEWLSNMELLLLLFNLLAVAGIAVTTRKIGITLKQTSSSIAESASDIAATVEEQELTTSIQASSVNETVTTMDELEASFQQATEQAEASAKSARDSIDLAETGNLSVEETLVEMKRLKERVEAIANQILQLSEQTGQIGDITQLVADLASRTNMLALNAAVEAANAGEYGKGFAVVASEIRKLADESKKASGQIYALVEDIQTATDATVMVTDEGTKAVDQSTQVVQKASQAFQSLAVAINESYERTQQNMLNLKQQSSAVGQVLEAMSALDGGAKETTDGIQQTIQGVTGLQSLAANLQAQV